MRRTRSSSRLGSTLKSKFRNDPKNALEVDGDDDDDDDFVSPPTGRSVQANTEIPEKREKNKSKSKKTGKDVTPPHISPPKPKRKKVLESEGETSVSRKEKRSKDKHDDKLKKKETIQKGKKGKPTVPEEEEKKSNKEYPPGTRRLPTRMTPGRMTEAVKSLSMVQQQCLIRMGFESFLKLDIADAPTKLLYKLIDCYNPATNKLVVNQGSIEMTKQLIHEVLGLPKGGLLLGELEACEDNNKTISEWKSQYKNDKNKYTYSGKAYLKAIQSSVTDDKIFQLNFLMLFLNTFCESNLGGLTQVGLLERLIPVNNYATLDWCEYMQECLMKRKQYWRRNDMSCYYTGPSTLLLLAYAYSTTSPYVKFVKQTPFIEYVSSSKLGLLEENEEKAGAFGSAPVTRRIKPEYERVQDETDADLLQIQEDFGDVEAYCAIIELGCEKIRNERKNIDKALAAGLKHFPNNEDLLEWEAKLANMFSIERSDEETESDESDTEEPRDMKGKDKVEGYTSPMRDNTTQAAASRENADGAEPSSAVPKIPLTEFADRGSIGRSGHVAAHGAGSMSAAVGDRMSSGHSARVGEPGSGSMSTAGRDQEWSGRAIGGGDHASIAKCTTYGEGGSGGTSADGGDRGSCGQSDGRESIDQSGQQKTIQQIDTVRPRRNRRVLDTKKSPFIQRKVQLTDRLTAEEINFCNSVLASERDFEENVWETEDGGSFSQWFVYHFVKNVPIDEKIIEAWSTYLNNMDLLRSEGSPSRLFFQCNMMSKEMFNESELEYNRIKSFTSWMQSYLQLFEFKDDLSDRVLVFFPINHGDMYYLLCYDLKKPAFYIIDHVKRTGLAASIYGKIPTLYHKFFCCYLEQVNHPKRFILKIMTPKRIRVPWEVAAPGPDDGIYVMRHMECYMGEAEGKWDVGFPTGSTSHVASIDKLRDKYLYRILTWEFNMHKDKLEAEAAKYKVLDVLEKHELGKEVDRVGKELADVIKKERKKKIAVKGGGNRKNELVVSMGW